MTVTKAKEKGTPDEEVEPRTATELVRKVDAGLDRREPAKKLLPTGPKTARGVLKRLARRLLEEDAYRDGEWVEFQGRTITNIELIMRQLMESQTDSSKVAIVEMGYGKEPNVNQVEGGIEVTFKIEHDDSWEEAPTPMIEGEFEETETE